MSNNDETEGTVLLDKQSDELPNIQGESKDVGAVESEDKSKPKRTRVRRKKPVIPSDSAEVVEVNLIELAPQEIVIKDAPKPKRTRAPRKKVVASPSDGTTDVQPAPIVEAIPIDVPVAKPRRAPRSRKKPIAPAAEIEIKEPPFETQTKPVASVPVENPELVVVEKPKRVRKTTSKPKADPEVSPAPVVAVDKEPPVVDDAPKKRGWWSLGR